MNCTTHYACDCILERLRKIDEVYERYKDMDAKLSDARWHIETFGTDAFHDFWQAIRPVEDAK